MANEEGKPEKKALLSKKQEIQEPEYNHQDFLCEIDRHLEELEELLNNQKNVLAGAVKLRFVKHIQQDRNWIKQQTGNGGSQSVLSDHVNPLLNGDGTKKNIMGYDLNGKREPIKMQDLKPKKDEKAKFADEVRSLYAAFNGMKDAEIINNLGTPGFANLVRGVAKVAKIKDWESCEIDVELFADIRESIKDLATDEEAQLSIEEEFEKFK